MEQRHRIGLAWRSRWLIWTAYGVLAASVASGALQTDISLLGVLLPFSFIIGWAQFANP